MRPLEKVIITGSSGFIGSNLRTYLQDKKNVEVEALSLRNGLPTQLNAANAIIHLAGLAHDVKGKVDSESYFYVNYELTKQVFLLFLESDIQDFIFFSSVKAVADQSDEWLTEEAIPNPQSVYGQSKLKAENYLLAQPLPVGKRLLIVRPCMTHGIGNKGNLNLLYRMVKRGLPYPLGAFQNQRSFLSVDNLSYLVAEMLGNQSVPSGIYHFADDDTLSTLDIVKTMAVVLPKKLKLWTISPRWVKRVAKWNDCFRGPFSQERLEKLTSSYLVSNRKIKGALGISKLPITMKDGLIKTIQSFQNSQ